MKITWSYEEGKVLIEVNANLEKLMRIMQAIANSEKTPTPLTIKTQESEG